MKEKEIKKSNVKGITLIALIITIIVMLILVGVTINIAINGGLFEKAKEAKRKTQEAIEEEQKWAEGKVKVGEVWYNSMGDYLAENGSKEGDWKLSNNGDTVTDGNITLNIGDYVNYTYDTVEEAYQLPTTITGYDSAGTINQTLGLKWRVLGVDANGCLTLISDKPTTDTTLGLKNAVGYNNGVYILNDICAKQYSNSNLGITARSINIEDIEAGFSDIGIAERNKFTNTDSNTQYKKMFTYTDTRNLNYPVLYSEENGSGIGVTEEEAKEGPESKIKKDGIEGSVSYYNENQLISKPEGKESDTASGALTCTQTYYKFSSIPTNYCKNNKFYEIIFKTKFNYWLASRFVGCDSSYALFGLRYVGDSNVNGNSLFGSSGGTNGNNYFLRPGISLGFNIKVSKCEIDANGTDTAHMHSLSKAE